MSGLTIDDPVILSVALASDRIIPGDTIFLANGTYTGDFVASIAGTEAAPIIIKPQNPGYGNVIIYGSINITGQHIHFYDIDFTASPISWTKKDHGVTCNQAGFGLYGCSLTHLHAAANLCWMGSGAGQVCENVFYQNGYIDGEVVNGHGIYTHNNLGGARLIKHNHFMGNVNYECQIYSEGNAARDYTVEENTIVYKFHAGGFHGLFNFIFKNNIMHYGQVQLGRYTYAAQNDTAEISGNEFIELYGGYTVNYDDTGFCVNPWLNLVQSGNVFYDNEMPSFSVEDSTGYSMVDTPTTKSTVRAFEHSARWIGDVTIWNNGGLAESVAVDFSSVLSNGSYRLRNTANLAETWAFEYTGASVNVPVNFTTTGWEPTPTGNWPIFGSFVIETA
jgi:hypothetical protein